LNIINDITNLFNSAPFHPPFVLYDQDELLEDVDRKIAIAFTALNDNFNDILESQIIQQPLENGEFRACDQNLLPRIVEFEAFFVPPPSDMLTYLSNMDEIQNKVEEYLRNKRTVVIKQNYPNNHLYTNLKIVKAHKALNQKTRGRLQYILRLQEIIPFQTQYSAISSNNATKPTNSGVVSK
jgi:hypothetical protein